MHNPVQSTVTCLLWIKLRVFMLTCEVCAWLLKWDVKSVIAILLWVARRGLPRFNKTKKAVPAFTGTAKWGIIGQKFTLALAVALGNLV
ncbi:hypothetical protein F5ESL0245_08045 [Lactobacillus sp. ESL0245]|nr:hypothetical protein F5ESL0247_08045 [Lactobacillus sp. ESL0247]RMC27041.1 hypothetical protein F5ESL0246_08045 [Lactobacillus sp. ESL0246]RMC30246.1 hypothetical protein F5ESL0245_08045 [Lactobacillus sp. ESL0245]RMC47408.1 hypothetical protein F5ESL0228_08170 [Lactobacillus sp. ESL0228]